MRNHLKFQLGKMQGETGSRFGAIVLFCMFVVYRLTQASLIAAIATFALKTAFS